MSTGAAALYNDPVSAAELAECERVVTAALGGSLRSVLAPANEAEVEASAAALAGTAWTQVALVAVELALAARWRAWGVQPAAVIGHSVGELAAACVSGVLSRESALRLAARRGELMAAASEGGMLAVAAAAAAVTPHLPPGVVVAAINSGRQCVIAGPVTALEQAAARLAAADLPAQRLPAAGAFHSPLMATVTDPLTAAAARLSVAAPQVPWISTVTGTVCTEAPSPGYWGMQVTAPVQWLSAAMAARAASPVPPVWLEVGPGHTLAHLLRAEAPAGEAAAACWDGAVPEASWAAAAAQLWTAGVVLDWRAVRAGARRRTVALPTYPFQRQRYWLESAAAPASAPVKRSDVGSWFYRPYWKQAAPLASGSPNGRAKGRRWLLFADRTGLCERIGSRLVAAGDRVIVVEQGECFAAAGARYAIRPDEPADYERLFRELDAAGGAPTDIVHCWSVAADGSKAPGTAVSEGTASFDCLLLLGRALSLVALGDGARLAVVTSGAHAVTGDERPDPRRATVAGPVHVLPAEVPGLRCAHVDILWDPSDEARASRAVDRLLVELLSNEGNGAVALRGAHRWIQQFETVQADAAAGRARLREQGVYLITGGLGGIGLALADLLAAEVRARLILVGRTPLPARADWDGYLRAHGDDRIGRRIRRVLALESAGAEVVLETADVGSADAMRAVLERARARFGALHGVIHAAGVAGGGVVALKTRGEAAEVLAPKVAGTLVLHALTAGEPLDFFVLCSSLASLLGGFGQADYCAANAFLDAFAQSRWCAGDERVISIDWDSWRDAGMALDTAVPADLARRRDEVLERGIESAEGQDAFLRVLGLRLPQVGVCTKDLQAFATSLAVRPRAPEPEAPAEVRDRHPRPALATAFVAPMREAEHAVCSAFAEALGIDRIGVDDSFFDLGGHSLLAVEVMARLNRRFGTSVPVAGLYEGLTPSSIAALFENHAGPRRGREIVEAGRPGPRRQRQGGGSRRRATSDARGERGHEPSAS
ncbi:MAG: KR domain-containing protein [Acidobacteria bacterium]|nr:KR domain-containing protein [Acidobacteriota bacterium]